MTSKYSGVLQSTMERKEPNTETFVLAIRRQVPTQHLQPRCIKLSAVLARLETTPDRGGEEIKEF
jgi:hypothetical protein